MKERSKLRQFFFGDLDDYGFVLILLYILTMASPLFNRSWLDFQIAPLTMTAYFVCYLLRFKQKETRDWWNVFKLGFTLLLFLITIEYHLMFQLGETPFFSAWMSWLFVYYIDRIIIRVSGKLTYFLTGIFMLICIFHVVYAKIQTNEAMKQKAKSEVLAKDWDKLILGVEKEAANARETEERVAELEAALKKCSESK